MSVIEDALRRAEADCRTAKSAEAEPGPPRDAAPAGTGAHRAEAWTVAAPRWRPSLGSIILVVLSVASLVVVTRPQWGAGLRRYGLSTLTDPAGAGTSSSAPGITPVAVQTHALQSVANSTQVAAIPGAIDSKKMAAKDGGTAPPPSPAGDPPGDGSPTIDASISARFRLEGVVVSGSSGMAVVNGTIVEVGQQIEGATVTGITINGIMIELDGQSYRLPMRSSQRGTIP